MAFKTFQFTRCIWMILKSITNSVMKGRNFYKQNNQTVHLCTKINFSLLFHHCLFFSSQTESAINSEVWRSLKHNTAEQTNLHNYRISHRFCNKQYIHTRRCVSIYSTPWRPLWLSVHINDIILILAYNRNKNTSLLFNPHIYMHKPLPQRNPSLAFSM